jgi:hypothetical protein
LESFSGLEIIPVTILKKGFHAIRDHLLETKDNPVSTGISSALLLIA